MQDYKITGLDEKTPPQKRDKLKSGLFAVAGVKNVELDLEQGSVAVTCRGKHEAKVQQIKAAINGAGFALKA